MRRRSMPRRPSTLRPMVEMRRRRLASVRAAFRTRVVMASRGPLRARSWWAWWHGDCAGVARPELFVSRSAAYAHPMEVRVVPAAVEPITGPASLPDEEVVRRVVAGEAELFELLMRRHNQTLYRAVRSLLRDEDEIEDAMQQAYLLAFSRLAQFEGTAKLSTWLVRIGINEA